MSRNKRRRNIAVARRREERDREFTAGHYGELLPHYCGPRMHPYPGTISQIQFQEVIPQLGRSVFGRDGYAFKVYLNSQIFILKILDFKFFDLYEERLLFSSRQNRMIRDEEFRAHLGPFYAECRAYGRIEEFYRKHPKEHTSIAARCYGYLLISAEQEKLIGERFGITDWNRQGNGKRSLRALVKEFIPIETPIDTAKRSIRRMLLRILAFTLGR
ncbi:hypothetical protein B0J12DRAFT_693472 [Macrophomina phaseolina]|uniref:Uncharacterized protein n=1 Tax=Macrophomina phaseolina TaxID=35725 RepID=A0ABQ8GV05_9PEZI|nr:hypothetical protein B0J12DRAFT_693472 [Macrophomina phaseolina]